MRHSNISMSTKKLSQLKNSSLLDRIAFHAVCFEGDYAFAQLRDELADTLNKIVIESDEDHKNFLKSDVEVLQQFQKTRTSEKRYFLTNLNIRNTTIQNMLLKVVEEPNENTIIIFVVSTMSVVLPTLRSRLQVISLPAVDSDIEKKIEIAKKNLNVSDLERLLYIKKIRDSGNASEKQIADYLAI